MRESATTLAPEVTEAELKALTGLISEKTADGAHLEIGTAAGGTLKAMICARDPVNRPRFVVVDPMTYFPGQREIVERNLRSAGIDPSDVEFRVGFSWPLFSRAEARGDRFSFIFVDGNHKAHHVIQDLSWARLLEPGGYLCLHDHSREHPGVVWAARHFLDRYPQYERVLQVDSLMILRKNAAPPAPEIGRIDRLSGAIATIGHNLAKSWRKRFGGGVRRG